MPWEILFRKKDDQPFEEFAILRMRIMDAEHQIKFYSAPSGEQKIEAARASGVVFPAAISQFLLKLPAKENARYEKDDLFIELYGFDSNPLMEFYGEVRGKGNPRLVLRTIANAIQCSVYSAATKKPLDLAAEYLREWQAFQDYVDETVEGDENRQID